MLPAALFVALLQGQYRRLLARMGAHVARKAYRISDTRYRAGAGTILELNSAQLAQTQAQLNYSQAIYDYLSAKAEYDRLIGREE